MPQQSAKPDQCTIALYDSPSGLSVTRETPRGAPQEDAHFEKKGFESVWCPGTSPEPDRSGDVTPETDQVRLA